MIAVAVDSVVNFSSLIGSPLRIEAMKSVCSCTYGLSSLRLSAPCRRRWRR